MNATAANTKPKRAAAVSLIEQVLDPDHILSTALAPPEPDLLKRLRDGALDRLITRSAIVTSALQANPDLRREADTNPDIVALIVAYVIAEFDGQLDHIVAELRALYGGEHIWIAKRDARARERQAADILRLFNGRNATEVARRLGCSRATVYRVVKQGAR